MRTLIVSSSLQDPLSLRVKDALRHFVAGEPIAAACFENAEKTCSQVQAEVIFVVLPPYPQKGLEVLAGLRHDASGKLLAVGQASDSKLILQALRSGADHYLDQSELETELEAALARFTGMPERNGHLGPLLGVLSASGGCGASTVAVNIAAALAGDHQECVLVDLNPGRGDLAALLNVKPKFSLADLCRHEARLDRAMFEKIMVRHPSGIRLLSAPPQFGDARALTSGAVVQALTLARRYFAHVVVDLEDCFHEEQVATLNLATGILLLARLDFTSLRNARRALEHLASLNIVRNRIRLVINNSGQPNELPVAEAEDALGEKITLSIPHDTKTIYAANNTGVPVVIKDPGTKVAQSFLQLAKIDFCNRPSSSVILRKLIPQLVRS